MVRCPMRATIFRDLGRPLNRADGAPGKYTDDIGIWTLTCDNVEEHFQEFLFDKVLVLFKTKSEVEDRVLALLCLNALTARRGLGLVQDSEDCE